MRRPSAATVMSALALFISLGGTGAAAFVITSNDEVGDDVISSRNIINGEVKYSDLGSNSVSSSRVAPDALTGADLDENSLAKVPAAANADRLEGKTLQQIRTSATLLAGGGVCDPSTSEWTDCPIGSQISFNSGSDSELALHASGGWYGRADGIDAGECRIAMRVAGVDKLGPIARFGQTGEEHPTPARSSLLYATARVGAVPPNELYTIRLRCREVAGDFVVPSPWYIELLRLGE